MTAFPDNVVGSGLHTVLFGGLLSVHSRCGPQHSRGHLYVTSYTEGFSHFVTSLTAPVASGWSDLAGVGFAAPLESAALSRRTRKGAVIADRDGGRRSWGDS